MNSEFNSAKKQNGIIIDDNERKLLKSLLAGTSNEKPRGIISRLKDSFSDSIFSHSTFPNTQYTTQTLSSKSISAAIASITLKIINAIINDYRIHSNVKASLINMSPFFDRLILQDNSFLYDINHPGRHFIDLICSESLVYQSKESPGQFEFSTFVSALADSLNKSKESPVRTIDKANFWLKAKIKLLKYQIQDELGSGCVIGNKAILRIAMAKDISFDLSKTHRKLFEQPDYIKIFVYSNLSNFMAAYLIANDNINQRDIIKSANNVISSIIESVNFKINTGNIERYRKLCKTTQSNLSKFFSDFETNDQHINLSVFLSDLAIHHEYIEAVAHTQQSPSTVKPFFINGFSTSIEPSFHLTEYEKVLFGLTPQSQPEKEDADRISGGFFESEGSQLTAENLIGSLFSDISLAKRGYWFDFLVNDKLHRSQLNWTNESPGVPPTMFMFKKLSGDNITMTARQLEKAVKQNRVYLVSTSSILTDVLKKTFHKST